MTDLESPNQLSDIKNGIVIFTDKGLCFDRLVDELDGINNVFNADVNTEVGNNLKTAFAVEYVPSAIFIKSGKLSVPVQGINAILRGAEC